MTGNEQLVSELLNIGILKSSQIIDAFRAIDRKDFVPDQFQRSAYDNAPLPIGHGQTISQPLTVAFMLELMQPQPGDKILDVGSGSGWVTALLAHIVSQSKTSGKVIAMELVPELCHFGEENIKKYDFIKRGIVETYCMSAANGLPHDAPFDKIIAAAASTEIPQAWKDQLAPGGRIVAPVGNSVDLVVKHEDGALQETHHPGFAFVPFVR